MAQCTQCLSLSDALILYLRTLYPSHKPHPAALNKAKEPTYCLSISARDSWHALVFYVEIKTSCSQTKNNNKKEENTPHWWDFENTKNKS